MFFGLTIEKLLLIAVIAALLIGPDRLPAYARTLARLTARARDLLRGARSRMKEEMGPEFDELDWRRLDPRQYDPRRIIRETLLDDQPVATVPAAGAAGTSLTAVGASDAPAPVRFDPARPGRPPFDDEAT